MQQARKSSFSVCDRKGKPLIALFVFLFGFSLFVVVLAFLPLWHMAYLLKGCLKFKTPRKKD